MMSALGSWFLSKSSRSRSSSISSLPSSSNQGIDKVLHGRVTKHVHAELTSSATKYKPSVPYSENNERLEEEDATFKVSLEVTKPAEYADESNGERRHSGKIKREEKEEGGGSEDERDDEENFGFSSAMVAQQADSEDIFKHDTGSESDPDTEPDPNTEPNPDTEPDPDTAWRLEQIYLNTILNARTEFTLMPSTWRMHFRGIPLPDSLFYIKTKLKSIRPRIYARTDRLEYRGALALRKLIDVHARIQDIREDEAVVKHDEEIVEAKKQELIKTISADMVGRLRRALEQALDWAKQDGEIEKYGDQLPPNLRVMELKGITETDEPESAVKIQSELCELAEEWRTHASNGDAPVQAPVIFGFVIMKHIITIVTLDASDPSAIIHVPCQLHMAERNQHQWNALAIMVTICWARDVLLDYINSRPDLQPEVKDESSDPDA
ncbi:hypothetical protein F4824DRAFT_447769 [Ustulina deusta]|nr:hypothetical protein F4824DRAFT_447769 [Ustulina deusta]